MIGAREPVRFWGEHNEGRRLADVLRSARPSGLRRSAIAHVGSADGIATLALRLLLGAEVVGFEEETTDRTAVAALANEAGFRQLPAGLDFQPIIKGALPSESGRFDAVLVTNLTRARASLSLLREVRRVVKPDGLVVVEARPLYFSARGAQLPEELVPAFAHLTESEEALAARLFEGVANRSHAEALLDRFHRLSRLTADAIQQLVLAADLRMDDVRLEAGRDEPIPSSLHHRALSELCLTGLTIEASRWDSPRPTRVALPHARVARVPRTDEPIPDGTALIAVFVHHGAASFLPTLRSIFERIHLPVVLGAPNTETLALFAEFELPRRIASNSAEFVNQLWEEFRSDILLIVDPVIVPEDFLDRAMAAVGDDLRIASVSFFSNSADFLSFPTGQPALRPPEGMDETIITRRLRSLEPSAALVPIVHAAGPAILISGTGIGATGPLRSSPSGKAAASLADYSLRARRKGLLSFVDGGTFYTTPSDLALDPIGSEFPPGDREWVRSEHPEAFQLLEAERSKGDSPFTIAVRTAHAKAMGLRVLIDAMPLGPTQMGTQTTILALIESLARRDDVAEVCVALEQDAPRYAHATLNNNKVTVRLCTPDDLSVFGRVDIGHRPFQPDQRLNLAAWRGVCDRFMVSILDIIGYQIGTYYVTPQVWLEYRQTMKDSLSLVDGVTTISEDVRQQVELEHLPIDPSRLFVIPYGTEHLRGTEAARVPAELVAGDHHTSEFLLCFGTNYSHKNRDLAIAVHHELRQRGLNMTLILAGAFVPFGSSRVLESFGLTGTDPVVVLPDISDEERNWLLRHAQLVLYPTSAEGFGLVPFEAARFGTATVHVDFGPLRELTTEAPPVVAADWSVASFADAAEQLLRDPGLAAAQVEASLHVGSEYSWARTAELLTTAYRTLIARPPRLAEGLLLPVRGAV